MKKVLQQWFFAPVATCVQVSSPLKGTLTLSMKTKVVRGVGGRRAAGRSRRPEGDPASGAKLASGAQRTNDRALTRQLKPTLRPVPADPSTPSPTYKVSVPRHPPHTPRARPGPGVAVPASAAATCIPYSHPLHATCSPLSCLNAKRRLTESVSSSKVACFIVWLR